ncbi:MAG: hypothetical protein EBS92_03975 [Proteobacteria bacterium]|nr:hypothetical protein [Pseudomonadota bacterium]
MILNSLKTISSSGFALSRFGSLGFGSLGFGSSQSSFLARNFSSCHPNSAPYFKIDAPPKFSEDLINYQLSSTSLTSQPSLTIKSFKPTSLLHIESQQDFFEGLLAKYPEFKEQIEKASNSPIVLISGLKVPEIPQSMVPKLKYDFKKIYNCQQTKIAELVAGLVVNRFVKFSDKNKIFDTIYPTQDDADRKDSFASSKELLWHNDGWAHDPEGQVALFCVNGNKSAITEVISSQQIIDYFKSNHKEHLLNSLQGDFEIVAGGEEYIRQQAKILDGDKIRYAKYGKFIPTNTNKTEFKQSLEAISELNKCLEYIAPALSLSLQNGDLLIIDNAKNLHRRKTADGETPMEPGTRLLLRGRIEDYRKNHDSKNWQR